MHSTILSQTPLHVNLRQGQGLSNNHPIHGTMIRMIGKMAVRSALKYSVVPDPLTILVSMMKQSRERNTLADSPTVLTV